jgi:hypothetical protein
MSLSTHRFPTITNAMSIRLLDTATRITASTATRITASTTARMATIARSLQRPSSSLLVLLAMNFIAFIAFSAFIATSTAFAQPVKVTQPIVEPPAKPANDAAKTEAAKAEGVRAKQRITQLKKLKMIELLEMNDQTAEKFLIRYNAEQKKVDDALKALNSSMSDLDKALQDPKKSTDVLKVLNDQTLDKQVQMQTAVTERLRSLRPILDERQYAKFMLFEAKFQEQVRKTLLDVKRDAAATPSAPSNTQQNSAQKK